MALRIEQGQNIKYIQNQLGHASIQTTLDRYGHLLKEVNTEQARKLDNTLGFRKKARVAAKEAVPPANERKKKLMLVKN